MGQPRPDKIALIERKDLCFILQAAKRSGGHNAVIVFLKFIPGIFPDGGNARPLPPGGQQPGKLSDVSRCKYYITA